MATGDMHGVAEAGGPSFSGGGTSAPGGPGGAGGLGSGTGAEQGELANAIANAMAAGAFNQDVWDPGYAEAQDVATQQNTPAAAETAIGVPGYNVGAAGQESFADWSTQVQPSGDQLSPGEQARVDASSGAGYQDVIGSNTGLAQAQLANAAFYAPPTVFQGEGGGGGYTPQSTGAPGASWNDPGSVMVAAPDMWMSQPQGAAPDMWMGQPQGMISQVDNQGRVMPGAITAGTGPGPTEGTINQPAHQNFTSFRAPGELSADYQAGTPPASTAQQASGGGARPAYTGWDEDDAVTAEKVAEIDAKVKQTPEWHTQRNKDLSQERLNHRKTLNEKAKTDPNGWYVGSDGKEIVGVTNAQVAAAYAGFDSTLEAYAVINGTGSLGQLLGMAIPFANALPMAKGFLVNNGLYDTSTGAQIADTIAQAIASGEPLGGGIGGPSNLAESGAIDQAVRDFVTQYPWAKGLDPRYIQYLIANPAEVESLLSGAKELNDVRIPV